jgi:PAS domain S-box-containing protein
MARTRQLTALIQRLVAFAIVGVLLIAVTVALFYAVEDRAQQTFFAKRELSRLARSAAALATDRETGVRGYQLTGNQQSLAPELVGRPQLRAKLDSLAAARSDQPGHATRLQAVSAALARWEKTVADPAINGEPPTVPLAGKPAFDEVRAAFNDFIAASEADLLSQTRHVRNVQLLMAAVILIELLGLLAALLYILRGRLFSQANELTLQQELLEQQAVELEMQVADLEAANNALAEREEKLRKSEERYRYMARATNDAVYEWNTSTNVFEWNERMTTLFGYSPEEIEDTPNWITSLVHADDAQRITDTFAGAFTDGSTQWTQDYKLRRRDGTYASVRGRAYILRDETGSPSRVIGAISDRTQQLSLETQLRQAQKMEAIGRLAGGIAHDFNNILTVIRMSSEFLLSEIPETDDKHQDAAEIQKAADRASRLTRQLLAFSRHQVLNPVQLSLNEIIASMEGMLRRVVPENIEFVSELQPDLSPIRGDAGHMEQVLLNLVINAADAMPGGGRLSIRTSNATVDASFSARNLDVPEGDYAAITVTDSGVGMDQETIGRIFEPFFTTKGIGKGTGLGLSTVHGIVTQSGGKIWVYSEPGMGTTFKIFFPRSLVESETTSAPHRAEEGPPPTETILLVEDESPTRDAVHRTLARAGYKILEASNGVEAMDVASSHNGTIDLVLTDTMMPEMGGVELAHLLTETRPDIRIVMMSGYTEDVISLAARRSDLHFIEKPFTRADLMAVLQAALKP